MSKNNQRPDISLPLLFVEDLANPLIEDQDLHHFERVLRVEAGEQISISDGKGSWRECSFGKELSNLGDIKSLEVISKTSISPKTSVGFCPLKGGRSDLIVAKLTEIGVDYMTPFFAERSVVRFSDEAPAQMKRWKKIIREAGMQSRRVLLPKIQEPLEFSELIETQSKNMNVARCDIDGDSSLEGFTYLLVGPEGGWSDKERKAIKQQVCLGPNVLRSETAAILAGARLVADKHQSKTQSTHP